MRRSNMIFSFLFREYHVLFYGERRHKVMITLTILTISLLVVAVVTVLTTIAGGTVAVILFGDIIVFIIVLAFIIKRLIKHYENKKK